jgi:hypothetical protein
MGVSNLGLLICMRGKRGMRLAKMIIPKREKEKEGKNNLRSQYSIKSFLTVLVVPSAMISKKDAHSPQLKPSASNDVLCCGFVRLDVARRAMRASASCWTVISGVVKKEAVSFQTVSLKGRGLAKKRSERLVMLEKCGIGGLGSWVIAYLRLKSCSRTPSRPSVSRSKVRAKGSGFVRTAWEKRMMASLRAML